MAIPPRTHKPNNGPNSMIGFSHRVQQEGYAQDAGNENSYQSAGNNYWINIDQ